MNDRGHGSVGGDAETVRIRMLGGFRVSVGDRSIPVNAWRLKKAASLVKLLALAPGHHLHREQAMEALWPELGRRAASNNLRQALHAARRALDPDPVIGSRYLASDGESLVLCPEGQLWVDAEGFEEAASTASRSREPAAYEMALDLYTGELLPGDRYEEWAEVHRRRLRETHLTLLLGLARLHEERADYDSAVEVLRRLVAEEPTREEAHVGLMHLHALSGSKGEALAQYERLEEVLLKELGTEPAASTQALKEEIASDRFPPKDARPSGSPPAEPPDVVKHNLPAARTSFVGREPEMVEIKRELTMTRLLTLIGAGGSGKTRLALEVAKDLVGAYPDGVWLVELAGLSDGELVPQAVAGALGVLERPGKPLTDTLTEYLRAKSVLLVVDNCEHLAHSVAYLLDTLLDSCPRLRVLATSREALGLAGEVLWRVPSLSVPDTDRLPVPGEMTRYEAVRLFAERARLRLPAFELTLEDAPAVAEVCRKLEGIPLAIELATARMGTLSVRQISERLQDPLSLLRVGGRTAVSRQRTLRGTLDWSYELLSESEQALFGRLSVFAGGWTLEAAEAVGAGDGIEEGYVLDLLSRLVDKSLVVTQVSGHDAPRYRMLEPVRQFAREKLEESGEAERVRERHARLYLALVDEAEPELRGVQQEVWLKRLEREHGNFRAALSWALGPPDTEPEQRAELGLRLAAALWLFWNIYGLSEGHRWLETALERSSTRSAVRTKALNGLGWITLFRGDYERAVARLEESLALSKELNDKPGAAISLAYLGSTALHGGDDERVTALREEGEALRRELVDRRAIAELLYFLANARWYEQRDYEGAEALGELFEEKLAISRELGDVRGITISILSLGAKELKYGDPERAETLLKDGVRPLRGLRDKPGIAYGLLWLAGVARLLGRPLRAARLWGAAEALRETLGLPLSHFDRSHYDYEGHLAAARAQLKDEAAWEAAWAQGRAMTPEQAVEYALSEERSAPLSTPAPEQPSVGAQLPKLTRREREVAGLVARGLTSGQIASELVISRRTVDNHVANILKKVGLHSREQIAARMAEQSPRLD